MRATDIYRPRWFPTRARPRAKILPVGAARVHGAGTFRAAGGSIDHLGGAVRIAGHGTIRAAAAIVVAHDVIAGASIFAGTGSFTAIWPGPPCTPWDDVTEAVSEWTTEQACFAGHCPA